MEKAIKKIETGVGVSDANFPLTEDGRVYHVGVKRGEGGAAGSVPLCSAATRKR